MSSTSHQERTVEDATVIASWIHILVPNMSLFSLRSALQKNASPQELVTQLVLVSRRVQPAHAVRQKSVVAGTKLNQHVPEDLLEALCIRLEKYCMLQQLDPGQIQAVCAALAKLRIQPDRDVQKTGVHVAQDAFFRTVRQVVARRAQAFPSYSLCNILNSFVRMGYYDHAMYKGGMGARRSSLEMNHELQGGATKVSVWTEGIDAETISWGGGSLGSTMSTIDQETVHSSGDSIENVSVSVAGSGQGSSQASRNNLKILDLEDKEDSAISSAEADPAMNTQSNNQLTRDQDIKLQQVSDRMFFDLLESHIDYAELSPTDVACLLYAFAKLHDPPGHVFQKAAECLKSRLLGPSASHQSQVCPSLSETEAHDSTTSSSQSSCPSTSSPRILPIPIESAAILLNSFAKGGERDPELFELIARSIILTKQESLDPSHVTLTMNAYAKAGMRMNPRLIEVLVGMLTSPASSSTSASGSSDEVEDLSQEKEQQLPLIYKATPANIANAVHALASFDEFHHELLVLIEGMILDGHTVFKKAKEIANTAHGFARLRFESPALYEELLRQFGEMGESEASQNSWDPQSVAQILDVRRRHRLDVCFEFCFMFSSGGLWSSCFSS